METKPLITTVIPTYNRAQFLEKAIKSALNQTMPHIQVSVFDNCSTDHTKEVVQHIAEQDARVRYIAHSSRVPAAQNFQCGLSSVDTPFFSILADDDLLEPDFYQTLLPLFSRYPSSYFVVGSTLEIQPDGTVVRANALQWKGEYFEPPHGLWPMLDHYVNWTGTLFRKEVLDRVSINQEVRPIDMDFMAQLCAQYPFALCKTVTARFIMHPHSYSMSAGLKLLWPSWQTMSDNLQLTLPTEHRKQAEFLMKRMLKRELTKLITLLLISKQFQKAREALAIFSEQFPRAPARSMFKLCERVPVLTLLLKTGLFVYRFRKCFTNRTVLQRLF